MGGTDLARADHRHRRVRAAGVQPGRRRLVEQRRRPAGPTPSADTVLVGTSTKAGKGGKLKLRLRCTAVGTDRCAGSLTLKLGKRKLTKAYSIAAGQEGIVTLKLGAGDRRRLARKRSLKSAATVVTKQPDGTRRITQQTSVKLLR